MDTQPVNSAGDVAQVLAVIAAESAAFWNKDFAAWADCWAHEPYTRTMGWWAAGGVTVVEGWEAQSAAVRSAMQASPQPNPTAARVRQENLNIQIRESVAWVTFDQYGEDTGDATMDMPGRSRETRILQRIDGSWKIVYVGWLLEAG
jgi:hypothetical protein